MVKYFDSDNKEIKDHYNFRTRTLSLAHTRWLQYWIPRTDKTVAYSEAFKIFEDSIELKTYATPKEITPYQIVDGYKWIASNDGKKINIVDKQTGKIAISKILSDSEYESVLLKRQRQKRKAFIDRALANPWTHWATLTFSSELAPDATYSYKEAKKAFMQWRKSIVRKYGCDLKYMAVAEYGTKYGRIHWHVLLHFDKTISFQQARSSKGKLLYLMNSGHRNVTDDNGKSVPKLILPNWKYGITDFYPVYNNQQRVVNYIAKYMTKGEGAAPYEQQGIKTKSYLASKDLKKPQKEYLKQGAISQILPGDTQNKLERAQPTFKLMNEGEEIMRKTEAVLDESGIAHVLNKHVGVIDIAKIKNHQSTSNPTDGLDNNRSK